MRALFEKVYQAPLYGDLACELQQSSFSSPWEGWAIGPRTIIQTTDGGNRWSNRILELIDTGDLTPRGIATSASQTMVVLSDGSQDLRCRLYPEGSEGCTDVSLGDYVHSTDIVMVAPLGSDAFCVLTSDYSLDCAELNLIKVPTTSATGSEPLHAKVRGFPRKMLFADERCGWIVTDYTSGSLLYETSDGGRTWTLKEAFDGKLEIVSWRDQIVYIAAKENQLCLQTPQTKVDRSVTLPRDLDTLRAAVFDGIVVILATSDVIESEKDVTLLASGDSGNSWIQVSGVPLEGFFSIHLVSDSQGLLLSSHKIFRFLMHPVH